MIYEKIDKGFMALNKKPVMMGWDHIVFNVDIMTVKCKSCGKTIIIDKEEKNTTKILKVFTKNHKGCMLELNKKIVANAVYGKKGAHK